jgi:hypothetical protein
MAGMEDMVSVRYMVDDVVEDPAGNPVELFQPARG